jgi:hypothetical protein
LRDVQVLLRKENPDGSQQTLYADILAHWVVNHAAAATSDRLLPEYVDCDKMFQDLVARSAEHGDAEVQTQVLAAHVEPAAGGSPRMGNGYDEDSDCDDGLGDSIVSGRYDIGSAGDLRVLHLDKCAATR